MLDIKFLRENPEIVKQNIRNKFQDSKLPLVDEVIALDRENREIKQEVESLRAERNKISKEIGKLMGQGKREEAEEVKKKVASSGARIDELSKREKEVEEEIRRKMMVIPQIIDPSVPIGKETQRTWRSKNLESRWFRISRSPITRRLWNLSTELTWTAPGEWQETDSIISWAISPDSTLR